MSTSPSLPHATALLQPLLQQGEQLHDQGDLKGAMQAYRAALALDPSHAATLHNLGTALLEQGDPAGAIAAFRATLQRDPALPQTHNNLGNALQEQADFAGAVMAYNAALALQLHYPEALNNRGNALSQLGQLEPAIASFRAALQLQPAYADAHCNLAMALLLAGHYAEGWRHYDARFQSSGGAASLSAKPQAPRWDGRALPPGASLLLVSEQGLGDTLQFIRYLPLMRQQGLQVSLCADPKLHGLIQHSGIDPAPLTPEQANASAPTAWLPLLSLPRLLQVSPSHPIVTSPYLRTSAPCLAHWREQLGGAQGPLIGINWQGNPQHERSIATGRSLPLETFAPLARLPHVRLLSLQKGPGSEQLARCSFRERFVGCQPAIEGIWDFLHTAAIIAACDLVISSDTAVAHLAAAMGKPTWLLLKAVPEWRWGLAGTSTFWYPSMRLFRQRQPGDWHGLLEQVAAAVNTRFQCG